jgi:T5SS/PEP-CTERM-associated repeat protein
MTISGGQATFTFLSVGNNADGLLSMSGGQLNVKPRTTNDWTQIGDVGFGQFNLSGGTVLLSSELHIGDDTSPFGTGSGVVSITGGQLIATNDITAIGRYSLGEMTISNAVSWLTNVSVGRHDGSVGILNVQSNAQLYLLDALSIARFSNSVGHVFVTGGLLSLTNDNIWVGREGIGDMTVSNGLVQAINAFVGMSTVVTDSITAAIITNKPTGTLTVAAGDLVLKSNLLVGTSLISTGQVIIAGGNLAVAAPGGSGQTVVSSGTIILNNGTFSTDNLILTNKTGQFNFNSGTLQASNMVVSNGVPFVIGDGFAPATLKLQGGTYFFADGLVISNNATVTGCGTIVGNISNFGTLATNCVSTSVTITSTVRNGRTNTIFFTTINTSNHVLEYKNSLSDSLWSPLLPGVIGTGQIMSLVDTNAVVPNRFYRIHLQ